MDNSNNIKSTEEENNVESQSTNEPSNVDNQSTIEPSNMVNQSTSEPNNVDNQPTNESSNISNQPTVKPKNNKAPIIILVIVLIAVLLGIFYTQVLNNPKVIVKTTINTFYDGLSNTLDKLQNNYNYYNSKENLTFNGDLQLNSTTTNKVLFNGGIDQNKKLVEVTGSLNQNNQNIGDISIYLKNNHEYIKSKSLFDNIYDIGEEDFSKLFSTTSNDKIFDDINFITKEFKDSLIKSLDKKYLKAGKDTIEINGQKVKVKSVTYEIKQETVKDLMKKLSNSLSKNDKLIDKIADLSKTDKNKIKENIETWGKEENFNNFDEKVSLIIYTKGLTNKFVGIALKNDNDKLVYYNYKNNGYMASISDGKAVMEITSKKEKENTNISINTISNNQKTEVVNMVVKKFDFENIDIDYTINDTNKITGTIVATSKSSGKKTDSQFKFTVNSTDNNKLEIIMNLTVEKGKTVNDIDVSKALPVDQMTPSDENKMSKALEKLNGLGLDSISQNRKTVAESTAYAYVEAAEKAAVLKMMANTNINMAGKCTVLQNSKLKCSNGNELTLDIKGEAPSSGELTLDKYGSVVSGSNLKIGNYLVKYENNMATASLIIE